MYPLGTIKEKRSAAIRQRREFLGLTQFEAAERCGLPSRTYQRAENGKEAVDLKTIQAIASGLEIAITGLVDLKEKPENDINKLRIELIQRICTLNEDKVSGLVGFLNAWADQDQIEVNRKGGPADRIKNPKSVG